MKNYIIKGFEQKRAVHFKYYEKIAHLESDKWGMVGKFLPLIDTDKWIDDACSIVGNYKTGYEIEYISYIDEEGSEHWNQFWGFNRPITAKLKDKGQLLLEFLQYQKYYRA